MLIESPFVSFYTIIKFAEWYVLLMFKKAFDNHNEIFVHFGESLSEAVKTRKQLILHERRLLKRSSLCGITSMHELVAVLFPHWLVRGWKKKKLNLNFKETSTTLVWFCGKSVISIPILSKCRYNKRNYKKEYCLIEYIFQWNIMIKNINQFTRKMILIEKCVMKMKNSWIFL